MLRAIGDPAARFREDGCGMLRAVRFAAVLGFEIEPATWSGGERKRAGTFTKSAPSASARSW